MRTNFDDVCAFTEKFDLPRPSHPQLLNADLFNYRAKFLLEETNEFIDANRDGNLADAADALVDIVYVALGTAVMMGLPWQRLWDEVQRANMDKQRVLDISKSKRHSPYDVIKPEGWRPPDLAAILEAFKQEPKAS